MRDFSDRGVSLGGTLLAVSVLSLLAFTLASLCVTHLRLVSQQDDGVLASNAARSAVSAAISKVIETKTFGRDRAPEAEVRLEIGEAQGYLTFNAQAAQESDLPYSTNNLEGTEDVSGAEGALVPSATVHLVAIGHSGNATRRIEAVLRVPPFPWAIASGGRIETKNGVMVGALPAGTSEPPADLELLLPADLVANGSDSQAILLGNNSTVLGDVETPGQVVLGPQSVEVRGEIRSGSEPVKLPTIHATDYDPASTGTAHIPLSQSDVDGGTREITGFARAQGGNLTFEEPLLLSNGQLFVDGNLTLEGGVQGTGMLIATGDITITAGAQLQGQTELAVVSGGRVDLRGVGSAGSIIRGLFYAERGLDAQELTLIGSLLTGNASTGVTLDNVNLLYEQPPELTTNSHSGLPEGEYNIGRFHQSDTPMLLGWFEESSVPMPDEMEPLFKINFAPTSGDFPMRVSFAPGVITLPASLNATVANNSELDALLAQLQPEIHEALDVAGLRDADIGGIFAARINTLIAQVRQAALGSETTVSLPSISLFGDISRFLPVEDRIRLVSWVER